MQHYISNTIDLQYVLEQVDLAGIKSDSRLGPMSEVIGLCLAMPANLVFSKPGFSRKLSNREIHVTLAGLDYPEYLNEAVPKIQWPFTSAQMYGHRISRHMPQVVDMLIHHPETRRNIVHIGDPSDPQGMDVEKPCMQSIQFIVRDKSFLWTIAHFRSWDLGVGFYYDTRVISALALVVGDLIGIDPEYNFVRYLIGSAHIYDEHLKTIKSAKALEDSMMVSHVRDLGLPNWASARMTALDHIFHAGPKVVAEIKSKVSDYELPKC